MGLENFDLNAVERGIVDTQQNPNAGDVFYDTNSGQLSLNGGSNKVKTTTMIEDGYAAN